MKTDRLLFAASTLILGLINAPGQTSSVHWLDGLTVLQDQSVSLDMAGRAPTNFFPYFDLYVLESSTNLLDWASLTTLLRTNASTNALSWTDTNAPIRAHGFYRTPTNHLI